MWLGECDIRVSNVVLFVPYLYEHLANALCGRTNGELMRRRQHMNTFEHIGTALRAEQVTHQLDIYTPEDIAYHIFCTWSHHFARAGGGGEEGGKCECEASVFPYETLTGGEVRTLGSMSAYRDGLFKLLYEGECIVEIVEFPFARPILDLTRHGGGRLSGRRGRRG